MGISKYLLIGSLEDGSQNCYSSDDIEELKSQLEKIDGDSLEIILPDRLVVTSTDFISTWSLIVTDIATNEQIVADVDYE